MPAATLIIFIIHSLIGHRLVILPMTPIRFNQFHSPGRKKKKKKKTFPHFGWIRELVLCAQELVQLEHFVKNRGHGVTCTIQRTLFCHATLDLGLGFPGCPKLGFRKKILFWFWFVWNDFLSSDDGCGAWLDLCRSA